MHKLGLSIECFRWDLHTPQEITYTDVVAGHLPVELRKQEQRREFNYMARPFFYFSKVPKCDTPAQEALWLMDHAAELGLDFVALPIEYLQEPDSRGAITSKQSQTGLGLLPWASLPWVGTPQGIPERAATMGECLRLLKEWGIETVVLRHATAAIDHHFTRPLGAEAPMQEAKELMRRLADLADPANITLALENHLDFRADDLAELVEAVAHPRVRACLNTGNCIGVIEDPLEASASLASRAAVCFLRDFRIQPSTIDGVPRIFGTPLGCGDVPLDRIVPLVGLAEPGAERFCVDVVPHRTADSVAWVRESVAFARRQLNIASQRTGAP